MISILLTLALAASETPSRTVSYADLDLRTPHDRAVLDRRIRIAIISVCGEKSRIDPAANREIRRCQTSLRSQINAKRDTAIARATRPTLIADDRH